MDSCAVCGSHCPECPHYQKACPGCREVKGQTFWAQDHFPKKTCPIFECSVNTKKLSDCSGCQTLPCQTFTTLKDPSMTDAEFQENLEARLKRLRAKRPTPARS